MSDLVGNPEDRFSHNEAHTVSDIHASRSVTLGQRNYRDFLNI